ncbi:unnamed protein product [Owenia fusiformis]|uniref:Calcineurin-like phosphoesterase domain-containing protein n=1 Tax=Owenia fusiformis TaxID=6347 RepID=A0A8S4PSS2_OWEFU|nr:unnamed protein product [Owenia fusiformis]
MILLGLLLVLGATSTNAQLKFYAIGDWGVADINQDNVAEAMSNHAQANGPIDFIVSTGDNFYPDGVWSADDEQFTTKWRDIYNLPGISDLTWYITVGNHDYGQSGITNNEWYQVDFGNIEPRWRLPNLYYNFTMPAGSSTVHFVAIDSQALRRNLNDRESQITFIDDQLSNSNADWKIVFGHHPPYTTGGHAPGSTSIRRYVLPAMEAANADVYLSGHDHNLEYLRKIDGRDIDYILSGGGGRSLYLQNPLAIPELEVTVGIESVMHEADHGFVYFEISERQMTIDYINDRGNRVYQVTRTKP